MYHVQVAALVLLAWALFLCWATSRYETCPLGWFGSRCQFKCRCSSSTCDREGQCLGDSKCQGGWFGPACQYADLAYMRSAYYITTDGDDDTCINDNDTNEVTIDLGGMYHITWVRILVSEPGACKKK